MNVAVKIKKTEDCIKQRSREEKLRKQNRSLQGEMNVWQFLSNMNFENLLKW